MTPDFHALLQLADYLERPELVPPERFRMSQWGPERKSEIPECGFVGCAIGHAAHSKLFPRLRMVWNEPPSSGPYPVLIGEYGDVERVGLMAVSVLFGISEAHARTLFMMRGDDRYGTPAIVASDIRDFVKGQRNVL